MRIAVCDDEKVVRTDLANFFQNQIPPGERCMVEEFHTGEQLVYAYQEKNKAYDLIILDMCMPVMDGLEAGKQIRAMDRNVKIIVLTNYAEYSFASYDMRPYHFLLKPFDQEKMMALYRDIQDEKRKSWQEYLNISVPGNLLHIPFVDILFLESQKQKVYIHTKDRTVSIYKKLSDIEPLLDQRFARTHKSFIVNLDYYESMSPRYTSICLTGYDLPIPISKGVKQTFVDNLKDYVRQYGLL